MTDAEEAKDGATEVEYEVVYHPIVARGAFVVCMYVCLFVEHGIC